MSETFAVMASMAEKDRLRIAELELELAALRAHSELLREAAQAVVHSHCRGEDRALEAIGKLEALLQESSDDIR